MIKGYKYRIWPTMEQKAALNRFFGVNRMLYNLCLEQRILLWKQRRLPGFKLNQGRQLTELREHFDFIKEVPSMTQQQTMKDLEAAYTNFFRKKGSVGFPKWKNRFGIQTIRFPSAVMISFDNNTIKLSKLSPIKVNFHRKFNVAHAKSVTLSKSILGKYYISIVVNDGLESPKKAHVVKEMTIGIDLGIKDFAIMSDSTIYKNNNFLKSNLKRLRIEQRALARKKKGSRNRNKQKLNVSRLHEQVRNRRTDFLHKMSTEIVDKYDTIVTETLKVSNMVKNRSLSRAISDMGWSSFVSMLKYKSEHKGKNFVQIGTFVPSSKMCSQCGNVKDKLGLNERVYNCHQCGYNIDRDLNAACNIRDIGFNMLRSSNPVSLNKNRKSIKVTKTKKKNNILDGRGTAHSVIT